ncbi:MAG: InlB B-repeat-containing protein, partial [Oscillospiraceae bacterium]
FTGWYTDEALTTPYDFDSSVTENITLYAGFTSAPYTVTASFSVTVETFDRGEPGETTFELEVIDAWGEPLEFDGVEVTASVTTNGEGSYPGTMSISGSVKDLWDMLNEGVCVRQVNAGEANWTYDDTVYTLFLKEGIVGLDADDDAAPAYSILIFPTILEETGNGEYYQVDWNGGPVSEMCFTNTYTSNQAHIRTEEQPEPDESTKPAGGNSGSGDKSNPQTGDSNSLAVCAALIAVSAAGMAAAGLSGKRGKNGRAK